MRTRFAAMTTADRRFWLAVALIALAGLVLRIVYVLTFAAERAPTGDAIEFHTLANNLAAAGYEREVVGRAGLAPTVRPHQLDHEAWVRLWVTSQA